MDITKEEATQLVKQIKARKKKTSKTSLGTKDSPLKHAPQQQRRSSRVAFVQRWDPRQGLNEGSEADRLKEIARQIQSVASLPKTSKYAQHKLKTLLKVQELLQQGYVRLLNFFDIFSQNTISFLLFFSILYRESRSKQGQQELDQLLSLLTL